jgi:hypothetical protein
MPKFLLRKIAGYIVLVLLFIPYLIAVAGHLAYEWLGVMVSRIHVWMRPEKYKTLEQLGIPRND